MKYLIILTLLALTSCFTLSNSRSKRYSCVRNLVEIKVPANEAIEFCNKNYPEEM